MSYERAADGEPPVVEGSARNTRAAILSAARDLFNTAGFDGTSIAMICDRVNIMAGNLTYYFPRKRDLVLAMKYQFDAEIGELQNSLLRELLAGARVPSAAETHRLLRSMLEIIWNFRFFFTSMMSLHRLDPRIVVASRQVEQQARIGLSQLVQRGLNEQAIQPLRYPNSTAALADNIWYLMWGCMFFQKVRDKDLEPTKAVVIDHCLLQLGALIEPIVPPEFIAEYCREVAADEQRP
ncbi:MAG: TetR/AcrR family transcriptional regulator [Pyrinomonadaceae bacterium]